MKKVGVYGGTFDPIHFGHINLALELVEKCHLDEVWFCPAKINPHKLSQAPTATHHRLAMLELALQDFPSFKIKDIECRREGPSYMIDTLRTFIEEAKHSLLPIQFYLLLGKDAIHRFFDWHQPQEIVKLVSLLIGYRTSDKVEGIPKGSFEVQEAIRNGMVPSQIMDISSTRIRERIKKGLYCKHLLPEPVLNYIKEHNIYV